MDLATLIGLLLAWGLVMGSIALGGNFLLFIDIPSMLIVGGGAIGAVMACYPLSTFLGLGNVIKIAFFSHLQSPTEVIKQFMDYANRARREGILSLEPLLKGIDDLYLRKGLQLTVDGLEPQAIQEILETEISYREQRHETGAELMNAFANFSPAMGMIGTVIGLIMMLKTMSDPSTIGPAMAVALITTFYGAMLANLLFLPLNSKLKQRSKEEIQLMEMMLEGILSISKGENPRIIEEKLSSYLPPKMRSAPS